MTVLKWILIIVGAIVAIVIVGGIGAYYWSRTIAPVQLTEADLQVGGSYPAEERQQILDLCNRKLKAPNQEEAKCGCVADRAGKDFSRFERLAFLAFADGDARGFVALTKGLIASGIPQSRIEELSNKTKSQADEVIKSCGLQH